MQLFMQVSSSDTVLYESSDQESGPIYAEDLPEGTTVECLCGEFSLDNEDSEVVLCPECNIHHHVACTGMKDLRNDEKFLCPHCWANPLREKLKAKTTLIVSPSSISFQWQEEIEKHQNGLSVFVYDGIQSHGFVSPATFARHDIVLTTYEVLKKELYFTDLPHSKSEFPAS